MARRNWRLGFYLHALGMLPCLPLLYFQGKALYKRIPRLPDASAPKGEVSASKDIPALRLLILGESTMAGLGVARHEDGFAGHFARQMSDWLKRPVKWKVNAVSGFTAKQVTAQILPKLKKEPVDLIVVGLGGNDTFELNRPHLWQQDVREFIQTIREDYPKQLIVFLNLPPVASFPAFTPLMRWALGNWVRYLAAAIEETVAGYPNVYFSSEEVSLEYMERRLGITEHRGDFFSDGVHPSGYTYELWAADFCKFLQEQQLGKAFKV
ncbi:MAG: SGNH/GDSL hydrolase family protein [Bacteroidota bacterium]